MIVPTKNSLEPCLDKCLSSIYMNIPVNRLIAVDGGSTDGTMDMLRSYGAVIIDDSQGDRATARTKGIVEVSTDWHAQVDSDCVLCEDWFNKALRYTHSNVGAVWGVAIPADPATYDMVRAMAILRRKNLVDMLASSKHYFAHDILLRTSLVRGLNIPKGVLEDNYIGTHITKQRYEWVRAKEPFCRHNTRLRDNYFQEGRIARRSGMYTHRQILVRLVGALPKSIWILVATRNFKASSKQFWLYKNLCFGWLYERFLA